MKQDIKKISVPSVLRKGLEAYRIGQGEGCKYLLRIPWENKETIQMEHWQFFVLEAVPECRDYDTLLKVFKDRFGDTVPLKDLQELFSLIDDRKLFSVESLEYPILSSMHNWTTAQLASAAQAGAAAVVAQKSKSGPGAPIPIQPLTQVNTEASQAKTEPAPQAGARESETAALLNAAALEDSTAKQGFKLFNPNWLFRLLTPVLRPFRHAVYLLPLMLIAAVYVCAANRLTLIEDSVNLFELLSLPRHVLLSMLTVNLAVTLLTGMIAVHYGAKVIGFCLVFYMLLIPRFAVRVANAKQLERRQLIWLHASPLILRLGFFAAGILVWYYTRTVYDTTAFFSLAVAAIGAISFLLTVNPLLKSSGYNLLAAYSNESQLRGKAFHAFMNRFGGKVYKQTDRNVLAAYALASMLFMIAFMAGMAYILQDYLEIYFPKGSWALIAIFAAILLWRTIRKLKEVEESYERSVQFQKWRDRVLPQKEDEKLAGEKTSRAAVYARRSLLVVVAAAMFIPYNYEVGGDFTVMPYMKQKIASEIAGILESVNYDGGEFVKKGEVIGQLSHDEYDAQEKIYAAKVEEQQAAIKELKNQPKPEELQKALNELETQKTRTGFSKAKADRLEKLYKEGTISLEDLEDARRIYEVDANQVLEKAANYQLIKAGASKDEIEEAEAKLKAYQEELDYCREKIAKSIFYMPFDGKIVTTRLKDQIGSYLNKGEALAMVENVTTAKAEIEVPESDIAFVGAKAPVRLRSLVNHDKELAGVVSSIDENVTEDRYGRIVKVSTLIDNSGGWLKTGMTGYAKIKGENMPLWKVLSLTVVRFVNVELWSWIP